MSPELLLDFRLTIDEQLKKADIFALGLVFAQLVLGTSRSPGLYPLATSIEKQHFKNRQNIRDLLQKSKFPSGLRSIVLHCLEPDPLQRPDALGLLAAINAYAAKASRAILPMPFDCRIQSRTLSSAGLPVPIRLEAGEASPKEVRPAKFKKLIQF